MGHLTRQAVLAAAHRLDPAGAALLAVALEPLARSAWPDMAWRFSRLTADGCPVEFAFSTHDPTFRATFEPAPPECPEPARLGAALRLLEALRLARPEGARIREWQAIQAGAALRWGCWLGLRMTPAGARAKLYVELPPSYPVPMPGVRPRMLGYDPVQDRTELYVTVPRPGESCLRRLLAASASAVQDRVLAMLAEVAGVPLRRALDWTEIGASFAGAEPVVALFCRARAARGGPAVLRRHFAGHAGYRALFAGQPDAALPDHGVVTFMPRADGSVELRAGVSGLAGVRWLEALSGHIDARAVRWHGAAGP